MKRLYGFSTTITKRELLSYVQLHDVPEPKLSEQERGEAIRKYRLQVLESLPTEDLLEVIAKRFKVDRHFRAEIRKINARKPDNPGRLGKLTDGEVYGLVHLQRLSGLSVAQARQKVANHFDMKVDTVNRKYEREVARIRTARRRLETDK